MKKRTVLSLLLAFALIPRVTAAAPAFIPTETTCVHRDSNFSDDGIFIFEDGLIIKSVGYGMTLDNAGRIIISGTRGFHSLDMLLVRLNTDGTLDTSFNGTGYVLHNAGGNNYGHDVAIAGGKILVAGVSNATSSGDGNMTIWRFLPDGSPDLSFDSDGFAVYGSGIGWKTVIDNNGKIVVAGDGGIWRCNDDGSPDMSFNGSGFVSAPVTVRDVRIDGNNRIVATGRVLNGTMDMAIWRFNDDGTPDASFNGSGMVSTGFAGGPNGYDAGFSLALDAGGKILAAGLTDSVPSAGVFPYSMVLWRYNPDGTPDTSFNGVGYTINSSGSGDIFVNGPSVIIAPSGKYMVSAAGAGFGVAQDMAVWRYNVNGSIDTGFNGTGVITYDTGYNGVYGDEPRAGVFIDAGGRIITAGNVENPDLKLAVWAYIDCGAAIVTTTPTGTPSASVISTESLVASFTVTPTPSPAYSSTPVFTHTLTPSPVITQTWTGTPPASTNTATVTSSFTNSSTQTPQPSFTQTSTLIPQPNSPTPTYTPTVIPILTNDEGTLLTYPNPYNPNTDLYVLAGMAQNAESVTINIYTRALRLIRVIPMGAPASGRMIVDRKYFSDLSTGIYHFIISAKTSDDKIMKSGIQNLIILK